MKNISFHVKQLLFLILFPFIAFSQFASISLPFEKEPIIEKKDTSLLRFIETKTQNIVISDNLKTMYYWLNFARKCPKSFNTTVLQPYLLAFPQLKGVYAESLQKDLVSRSGLPLLNLNATLTIMAQEHATDMAKHKTNIGHSSSNGQTFTDRIRAYGINYCAGENLSFGSGSPLLQLVLLFLDVNYTSMGHRKSLLNPIYTEIGLGDALLSDGEVFYVQDFSCSPSQ